MIYKFLKKSTFIIALLFILNPAIGTQTGRVEYDGVLMDYSKLNTQKIKAEANQNFIQALETGDENQYDQAMKKYYLLTKIDSEDIRNFVCLARVYDHKSKDRFAKEYFFKATNLNVNDGYANLYFGDFFYKRNDFKKAYKYYRVAYLNGLNNNYDLNYKLGVIAEKFGDLEAAKRLYTSAVSINNSPELREKILKIDNLDYGKSEYYRTIRE